MKAGLSSILRSLIWPGIFIIIMWSAKLWEFMNHEYLVSYGVNPRELSGLKGILFSPFIHGDFKHLISNSIPFLFLGAGLFYFYRTIAFRVIMIIWLMGGFWLWLAGRVSFHIGASGIVYGLAFFLFLSGLFRKERQLMAFSLLVAFLYGSLVWGIIPLESGMSWEGHLFGALSGILAAIIYRDKGPQRKKYSWEIDHASDDIWYHEMDEINHTSNPEEDEQPTPNNNINIVYHLKQNDKKENE